MADDNNIPPPPPPPGAEVPPPPPPPGGMEDIPPLDNAGGLEQASAPAVAAPPGKALLILGLMIVFVIFLLSQIFGGDDSADQQVTAPQPRQVAARGQGGATTGGAGVNDPIDLPAIIDAPPAQLPPPPPQIEIIAPTLPPAANVPLLGSEPNELDNEQLLARQRSPMLVVDDTGGSFFDSGGGAGDGAAEPTGNPNVDFANQVAQSNTQSETARATHIGNLRRVVGQGRLIHAVLESGINTDLPGPIRAVVSRDIFPEAGREKIIPRGTRLIGTYNSNIEDGQARILIVWTRLVRPDGVDILINSAAVDQLGVSGIPGTVDNKFGQLFTRALLTSSINIAIAIGADEIIGDDNQSSSTLGSDGSTTESGSSATLATVDTLDRLGSVTESYLDRFLNIQPTITLDQGTKMNVFVNRDLIFPANLTGANVIQ